MNKNFKSKTIRNTSVLLGILVNKRQKLMLKELAEREDSSMSRYIRRLIERNYEDYLSTKFKDSKSGGEYG